MAKYLQQLLSPSQLAYRRKLIQLRHDIMYRIKRKKRDTLHSWEWYVWQTQRLTYIEAELDALGAPFESIWSI